MDRNSFRHLPTSTESPGNLLEEHPWVYRGSDPDGHHFTHTWHAVNRTRQKQYTFKLHEEVISPTFLRSRNRRDWRAVEPVVDEYGRLLKFKTVSPAFDRFTR